jgi:hypothetical protein
MSMKYFSSGTLIPIFYKATWPLKVYGLFIKKHHDMKMYIEDVV